MAFRSEKSPNPYSPVDPKKGQAGSAGRIRKNSSIDLMSLDMEDSSRTKECNHKGSTKPRQESPLSVARMSCPPKVTMPVTCSDSENKSQSSVLQGRKTAKKQHVGRKSGEFVDLEQILQNQFSIFSKKWRKENPADRKDVRWYMTNDLKKFGGDAKLGIIPRVFSVVLAHHRVLIAAGPLQDLEWIQNSMHHMARILIAVAKKGPSYEQDVMKYHYNVFMCRLFKHTYDKVKLPSWLDGSPIPQPFTPFTKRLLGRLCARRDQEFIYSFQRSKASWVTLNEEKWKSEVESTITDLCRTESKTMPSDYKRLLIQNAAKIFGNLAEPTKLSPSLSSCTQSNRESGGAYALFDKLDPSVIQQIRSTDDSDEDVSNRSFALPKLATINLAFEDWRQKTYDFALKTVQQRLFETELPGKDPLSLDDKPGAYWNDSVLIPLPEPSKLRPITKMDGYLVTALQPAQGQLIDAWKNVKYNTMSFDVLESLTEIAELTEELVRDSAEEWVWVSGDYSSATNKLSKSVGVALLQCIPTLANHELAVLSFMGSRIFVPENPSDPKSKKYSIMQTNGQLMGHPLSFPLLCVENLTVWHTVLHRAVAQGILNKLQAKALKPLVVINGDDIIFRVPLRVVPIFYQTSSEIGFSVSVGKNYVSSDTLLVNSRLFTWNGSRLKEHGYLNQRYITGFDLKAGGESLATPSAASRDLNKMCSMVSWAANFVPGVFRRWDKNFAGCWFRPSWTGPVDLGGYGLDPQFVNKVFLKKEHYQLAYHFIRDPKLSLFAKLGKAVDFQYFRRLMGNPRLVARSDLDSQTSEEVIDRDSVSQIDNYAMTVLRATGLSLPDPGDELVLRLRRIKKLKSYPENLKALYVKSLDRVVISYEGVQSPKLRMIRGTGFVTSHRSRQDTWTGKHFAGLSKYLDDDALDEYYFRRVDSGGKKIRRYFKHFLFREAGPLTFIDDINEHLISNLLGIRTVGHLEL